MEPHCLLWPVCLHANGLYDLLHFYLKMAFPKLALSIAGVYQSAQ